MTYKNLTLNLIYEKDRLNSKAIELHEFISDPMFECLPKQHRDLFKEQYLYITKYRDVLGKRLDVGLV